MHALDRDQIWPAAVAGVAAMAWLTLAAWEQTPYARYLDHGGWLETGFVGALCRATPAGPIVLPGMLYAGGWLLMLIAMMLPTALPLVSLFARMVRDRPGRDLLITLLIAGYLSVWCVFGLLAHALDTALHAYVASNASLAFNGWAIGAAVIGLAGAFQFSRLKYHCLDQCRTPFSLIARHWRGRAILRQSFQLGLRHGLFCIGCCWAIMILMFAVGMGNVGWMLAIGAVMAAEKNARWGPRLSAPLGIALLLTSTAIVALHL
jgi:predicted metal-binding membrane protein